MKSLARLSGLLHALRLEQLEDRRLLSRSSLSSASADFGLDVHFVEVTRQDELAPFTEQLTGTHLPPRRSFWSDNELLTSPSADDDVDVVIDFFMEALSDSDYTTADLLDHVVTDQYASQHTNTTHLYLRQTYGGLEIADANANANLTADGQVINAFIRFIPGIHDGRVDVHDSLILSAPEALRALGSSLAMPLDVLPTVVAKVDYDPAAKVLLSAPRLSPYNILGELHFVPTNDGIELAWRFEIATHAGEHWYNASVSAENGRLLRLVDWVDHARYNVFPLPLENPVDGTRAIVVDPHEVTASPFGWHDDDGTDGAEYDNTRGNNVVAREDTDADDMNGALANGGASLNFDHPLDLTKAPSSYQDAAITNLFYWNNVLHDIHFQYGFDEAAGNFQQTNYSSLGEAGDPVLADAQDGFWINNATMATPPDGQSPRMEMYIWENTTPSRDSDLDNGVIIHEYGHGVTNRLTGGPTNADALFAIQSASLGEGWSDWWSLMLTQKPDDTKEDAYPLGAYSEGLDEGIRRHPYSFDLEANPITFGDFNSNNEVHDAGEIWTSALWDLNWVLIDKHGFDSDFYHGSGGNNLAMQLVMDGLKLQPDNPSFIDARDAILVADNVLTDGENQREIWTAFARRGLGYEADDGGGSDSTTVTESFDIAPGSKGQIRLERETYEIGDYAEITVLDGDLVGSGSIRVRAESESGETRFVTLDEGNRLGVFRGTVELRDTVLDPGDPGLEVDPFDTVTVSYVDDDDGSGVRMEVQTSARVVTFADLLSSTFEDVDGGRHEDGFQSGGLGNQWHLTAKRGQDDGHSSPFSFHFGDVAEDETYADSVQGVLLSPMISLKGIEAPAILSFHHRLETDGYDDLAMVEIISNGDPILVADNTFNGILSETDAFEQVRIELTEHVGKEIQIRFTFKSDDFWGAEGWYVDDVLVRGVPGPLATVSLDSNSYFVGDTITISITDAHFAKNEEIDSVVRATSGDTEVVVLSQQGGGLFRGTLLTTSESSDPFDGVLHTSVGERIRAFFVDFDDGQGQKVEVQDTALVAAPPVPIFSANFEADDHGFFFSGNLNQWHLTDRRADDQGHGGGRSVYFGHRAGEPSAGSYASMADGMLATPFIDLGHIVGPATLKFNSLLSIEHSYDTASVGIWSIDDRQFIELANSDDGSIPNNGSFVPIELDITPFIGIRAAFNFLFRSDFGTQFEGWYIDDIVVTGTLPGPRGVVRFDIRDIHTGDYETNDVAVVTVLDSDRTGEQKGGAGLRTEGGDFETIELNEEVPGVFRGGIRIGSGQPEQRNGILEPVGHDVVSTSYFDENDGSGRTVTWFDHAGVDDIVEVFRAGFSDAEGNRSNNGFQTEGYANQWHHSFGNWEDVAYIVGHDDIWTYYFGAGEVASVPGWYRDDAFGLLTSPVIDLRQLDGLAVLEFNHHLENANGDDLARVLIVSDGVAKEIARSGKHDVLIEFPTFARARLDISDYVGSQIQVQFEFTSDQSLHVTERDEGWYVDDIVVKGRPISHEGSLRLGSPIFELGQPIGITVSDLDLAGMGSVLVHIESDNGDLETTRLVESTQTRGRFHGEITVGMGKGREDGVIQSAAGGFITVTYVDSSDHEGNEVVREASARLESGKTELFHADFNDSIGDPTTEGFVSSGRRDLWHVASWSPDDYSHSVGGSFYFGANQQNDQPGNYFNFSHGTLSSPVIDLGAMSSDITLSFNHLLLAEEFADFATVSVRSGGESTLLTTSDFFGDLPISHRFIPLELDLSDFAGKRIQIEFHFESDNTITDIGWYVDDVVVRGVPIGSSGRVAFEDDLFETNQAVGLQVADWDLRGQGLVDVVVSSQLGDSETVTLQESGPGIFRGDITITSLASPETNGVLEIANRDNITVSYVDEINAQGVSSVISDTATATTLVDVFRADFQDEGGLPFADGFQFAGDNNPWHVSVGRAIEDGHSPIGSFYFGRNEDDDGGGFYHNSAYGLLTSPLIDLREFYDEVFLEFNHVLDLRYDDDVARVLVSVNDERSEIASSAAFFFGTLERSDEFSKVRIDISEFAGQEIRLHFEMSTDEARRAEGWYVDDVTVRALPAVPVVDLNGPQRKGNEFSTVFVEGDNEIAVVSIDPSEPLTIIDKGNREISGAIVRITNRRDGALEVLQANTEGTAITSRVVDESLLLEGIDSIENYETVLRSITYSNQAFAPDPSDRTISFTLRSELAFGEPVSSVVSFQFVDSGPVKVENDLYRMEQNSRLEVTRFSHRVFADAIGYGIAGNDVTHVDDLGDPTSILLVDGPHDKETGQETGVLGLNPDGTFSFSPPNDYVGTVEFSYRVDDGFHLYGPATVTIKVVEDLPLPTIAGLSDVIMDEDTTTEIPFSIADPRGMLNSLTLLARSSNQEILPDDGLLIDGTGTERRLKVVPNENRFGGPVTIFVIASNGIDSVTESFQLSIRSVNDPPQLAPIAGHTIDEDANIEISFTVADVETPVDELIVGVESNNPQLLPESNILITGPGANRTLTLRPLENAFGTATVTLTVTDTSGSSTTRGFSLTVEPVNDPPRIVSDNSVILMEGQLDVITVSAVDVDGDSLIFALIGGIDQNRFSIDSISGQLKFSTAPDFESPTDANADNIYEVVVSVDDGAGATSSRLMLVEVQDVSETAPTVVIEQVNPDKRAGGVEEVILQFSMPISGIAVDDIHLSRSRVTADRVDLGGATLHSTDNMSWTLGGLSALTGESGIYTIQVDAAGSGFRGENGVALASDATMRWTNGAGDSNEDNAFDQFDIILILQGGKYLTGNAANWREGDWNGDGLFDQFDIIVAQQTQPAHYLTGRFNARIY